jgi:hypothetical protein
MTEVARCPVQRGTLPYGDRYRNTYLTFARMRYLTASQIVASQFIVGYTPLHSLRVYLLSQSGHVDITCDLVSYKIKSATH